MRNIWDLSEKESMSLILISLINLYKEFHPDGGNLKTLLSEPIPHKNFLTKFQIHLGGLNDKWASSIVDTLYDLDYEHRLRILNDSENLEIEIKEADNYVIK